MDLHPLQQNFLHACCLLREDSSLLDLCQVHNEWFLPGLVQQAIDAVIPWFEMPLPAHLLQPVAEPKQVGLIMAGNLPLVGLHDLFMVLLAGHRALVRTSSKDALLPHRLVASLEAPWRERVEFHDDLDPESLDYLIATGSNNTARYLDHRYAQVPRTLRKNRYSVAVLRGGESEKELKGLAQDVLLYHGMGCRSVSNLLLPASYDPSDLLQALAAFPEDLLAAAWHRVVKWENAIRQMEDPEAKGHERIALQPAEALKTGPLGVLNLVTWEGEDQLQALLAQAAGDLQCVVGREEMDFGQTQFPGLLDYADGVDTWAVLSAL